MGGYKLEEIEGWLFWEANRIGGSLPNYRFLKLFTESPDESALRWLHARMHADMAFLDAQLANRPFILGQEISMVDMSCSGYLLYRDLPGLDFQAFHNLADWLDRISAQPGWLPPQSCMS
jgi:glutathione S-transferase